MIRPKLLGPLSFFVLCALVNTAHASPSLCLSEETVIFSCSVKKKILSLCATSDISSESGHLTYRFGMPEKLPELVYPSSNVKPIEAFRYGFSSGAKGVSERVSFKVNSYTYTIYSDNYAFGGQSNGAGLVVEKLSQRLTLLQCSELTIDNNLHELKNIGLPESEIAFYGQGLSQRR